MFRTRFEGGKLPSTEAVKHTRSVGNLVYEERVPGSQPGRGICIAMLLHDDGETYVIPVLDRAIIRRIRGGILISGREIVPRGRGMKNIKSDNYPQTWCCRPIARTNSGFEHDFPKASPAESRRQARELEHSIEAERIAEAINRRPTRRIPHNPATASDHYLGHF